MNDYDAISPNSSEWDLINWISIGRWRGLEWINGKKGVDFFKEENSSNIAVIDLRFQIYDLRRSDKLRFYKTSRGLIII